MDRRQYQKNEPMQAGLVREEERVQTPVNRRKNMKAGSPSTPNNFDGKGAGGPATPDMTCPKPRRAFPGSPEGVSLPVNRSDTVEEELRMVLTSGEAPRTNGSKPGGEQSRPVSSVSTSAGPTPSPDGRSGSPQFTPQRRQGRQEKTEKSRLDKANGGLKEANGKASLGAGKAMPSQIRKVFVGGIPQDMQQDDLFKLFSEKATVKKAWLQRYREDAKVKPSPAHNHRGFGFIIFQDYNAVDQLLGQSQSIFLQLKDGRKLEVKRAVSSSDMTESPVAQTEVVAPRGLPLQQQHQQQHHQQHQQQQQQQQQQQHHQQQQQPQHIFQPTPQLPQPMAIAPAYSKQLPPLPEPVGQHQPPQMHGCWPADPRGVWMSNQSSSPIQHPSMLLASHSPAPTPWPTSGGDTMPPQSMSPPPQQVQQLFPAVATGGCVPLAAPTAVRAHPGTMHMPAPCWMQSSQTPPPMHVPTAGTPVQNMPCSPDVNAHNAPHMFGTWGAWAVSSSPVNPPQGQQMPQQMPPQQFAQQNGMAWQQQL